MYEELKEQNSIFDLDGYIANFNFFINSIKIRFLGLFVLGFILFYIYLFIDANIGNKISNFISAEYSKSLTIIIIDFLMLPLQAINIVKRLNHITGNKKFVFIKFMSSILMFVPLICWIFTLCLWFIKGKKFRTESVCDSDILAKN